RATPLPPSPSASQRDGSGFPFDRISLIVAMWDRGSDTIGDGRHSEPARRAFAFKGVLHYRSRTGSWVDSFPRVARCTVKRKAFDVTLGRWLAHRARKCGGLRRPGS